MNHVSSRFETNYHSFQYNYVPDIYYAVVNFGVCTVNNSLQRNWNLLLPFPIFSRREHDVSVIHCFCSSQLQRWAQIEFVRCICIFPFSFRCNCPLPGQTIYNQHKQIPPTQSLNLWRARLRRCYPLSRHSVTHFLRYKDRSEIKMSCRNEISQAKLNFN